MTLTDERTILDADLDLSPACDWCPGVAAWIAIYDACHHQHIICERCKRGLERRQQVADEAMPPRPLGMHGCCGRTIYRAGWVAL